jgi:ParB-like chromosome segregation protein Spo0J
LEGYNMTSKELESSKQELHELPAQIRAEHLEFHPLANVFPLLEGKEFDALVADIKANGLRERITLYEDKILDGRDRYRACLEAGIAVKIEDFEGDEADALAFVISKNIHRRHLTPKLRRSLLVELVTASPEKADRVIAREANVEHKQVSRARRKAESTGAIAPVDKRTGADGKARKQPARRKPDATEQEIRNHKALCNEFEAFNKAEAERGRMVKFTPERMDQIKNLVERGMSKEEIASTVGVPVGALQVACSRAGISLSKPLPPAEPVSSGISEHDQHPGRDIGAASSGECERLRVRNAELENEVHRLKRQIISLDSEIGELKAQLLDIPDFLDRTGSAGKAAPSTR